MGFVICCGENERPPSTIDVSTLDGGEPGEGVGGADDDFRGGFRVFQQGVELDAKEFDFRVEALVVVDLFELLHLLRGEVLGVEAVLAGVLFAGLAAALALVGFVHVFLLFGGEVVERAFGGFLGDAEGVQELFEVLV